MEELLELLMAPRREDTKSKGVFLTTITFGDEKILFSPNQSEVLSVLNSNVVEGMLWCVTQTPRLLHIRNLAHYFDGKLTGLHPVSIIKQVSTTSNGKKESVLGSTPRALKREPLARGTAPSKTDAVDSLLAP